MIELAGVEFGWRADSTLLSIPMFRIAAGERVFLRGPSGSGKSTLLGLVGGVLEPRQGTVTVSSRNLSSLSRAARDRFRADHIGFIFQMFNLIPYLSVLDNVLLPARFSAARSERARLSAGSLREEAERLLKAVGLDPVTCARQVTQLSQGQQQRVAAARALFGRPEILIADEPTSSLDADAREQFLSLLSAECTAAEAALLFVSHDTSLSHLFDRSVALTEINRALPQPVERAA